MGKYYQIQNAFALTRHYGIMARSFFIYGCPQERRVFENNLALMGYRL
jgi:hypothetical protein